MLNDEDNSLHTQELDKSILYHLFLPIYLPNSNEDDFLIQNNYQNEYELLNYLKNYFNLFEKTFTLSIFSIIKKCIKNWLNLQNQKNLTIFNLQSTIQQLDPGEYFSLYFPHQNAAILIEIDKNHVNQPLISSWQVSLPTHQITSSLKPHLSSFPVSIYRLEDRSQLITKTQCELLIDFMEESVEQAQSTKGFYSFNEIRDVPQSHYVTQWWITQFQGTLIEKNADINIQFTKKHRDQIRWKNAMAPFRRSGLWMTIKVVLQTILTKHLKDIGTLVYKLLVTHFLTYAVYTRHRNKSTELLIHCCRKISRRLNKIDGLLSIDIPNDIDEWIQNTIEDIRSKLQEIIPKPDWQQSIRINEIKNQKILINNLNLNDSEMYHHSCQELKKYLDKNVSHNSEQLFTIVNTHCNTVHSNMNEIDFIPFVNILINQMDYSIGNALTRVEIWIEGNLKQWLNRSSLLSNGTNRCETLLSFFEDYQNYALNHYSSRSDSIGYSRFILTSLTIISIMHENLCQNEQFKRLTSHSIHISHILELFEYLLLPNRNDMMRAYQLYNYFQKFKNQLYPDLLSNITLDNAFGVYFAECSTPMKKTLQQIQEQCERDKQAKIQEVNQAKEKYRTLMNAVNYLICECDRFRYTYRTCEKCCKKGEANGISVSIYECPIPSKRTDALAVIFELQMPIEIRCYREILWQFINRPHPKPSHNMCEWLKTSPHREKLTPYYTGPQNTNIKLLSSVKSITQSHYSGSLSIATSKPEDYLFENGLNIHISPTKGNSLSDECKILTPQLYHADYKHLQFSINNTEFVQNRVIAELCHCSIQMKPSQFIEFGSFRSGHCLQWWNFLTILEMESLPIDEESVVILIIHSLLQYGPVTANQTELIKPWCSEAHRPILEDHIVDEFILRLNQRLDDCEYNWQNELVLILITMITMRILTICNVNKEKKVATLALKCRRIGEKWIDLIRESIQIVSSSDLIEGGKLRNKIVTIAIACLLTYAVHFNHTHYVLSSDEHIISLLKAITTYHDNLILNKKQINTSIFMEHMIRYSEHVLLSIQPEVKELIEKSSYQCLNEFSRIYWAVIGNNDTMDGNWKKRTKDIYDGWYDGQYQSVQISIDCLCGKFLVNSMTIGYLPETITSNELFIRVFGNYIFEVQADQAPKTYITQYPYHHPRKIRYTFNFDDRNNHLVICEFDEETNDKFQLISPKCFENELADLFVSNYSHWRNIKNQVIEFRPVQFKDPNFVKDKIYVFNMKTGHIFTTDKTQILINQSSTFFQNLYNRYFNRLDYKQYVYMMRDDALQIINKRPVPSETIIHIYLSRLGISFIYNSNSNIITSREYSDMYITENQWLGTLTGLQFGLVLSPLGSINTIDAQYQCRKLIMPYGQVHIEKKRYAQHQIVTIERTSFVHQYFVFNLNNRLRIIQSTDSPTGWLYLALLHAITSHPLSDEYTGMTGMERSFQLLKSAGCWNDQPFDQLSLAILLQIASISPRVKYYPEHRTVMQQIDWRDNSLPYSMQHFGYYLIVLKLIETSQQLNFMYPSTCDKSTDILTKTIPNNVKLLRKLYWDYRDSYNYIARLPEEMENEIFLSCSTKTYAPTLLNASYSTTYGRIRLEDDLYRGGSLDLKRPNELNCFPLNKWLAEEFQLKNVWIGLLQLASSSTTRNDKNKIESFELLLDFLHYISNKVAIRSYYLQMLRTVLNVSTIQLTSGTFPMFGQYENIEEISVQKGRLPFTWSHTYEQKQRILESVKTYFERNRPFYYRNQSDEPPLDTDEINRLFKIWRQNKNLRLFLQNVESSIHSQGNLQTLNSKIPIKPQQFKVESIENHHRINVKLTNQPINSELLSTAEQNFYHYSSNKLVRAVRSVRGNSSQIKFPEEVFPSENSRSEISNHFRTQLYNSWQKLISIKSPKKKYPSKEMIKQYLHSSGEQSKQFWDELIQSIHSTNELLFDFGLLSRLIPFNLISIFLQSWLIEKQQKHLSKDHSDIDLTKDQCTLLGGLIVNWIYEQQLERALHFLENQRQEDFEKEISNQPHTNWKPYEHLPWLILELEMNITIRAIQVQVAYHMMQSKDNSNTRNIVMQMNMGEGKTSVIIPMLAVSLCSSSSSLVRIIVLKSLFRINYQSLRYKLGGLLNRRIFPFMCRRNMNFNQQELGHISQRFEQGLKMCDIILTSPESILSFDLLTIDRCRRKEFDTSRLMLKMQRWLKMYIRDVLDESDEILHVKYQLIYTIGSQQQVDGGEERWHMIQSVLHLVKKYAKDLSDMFQQDVYYRQAERKSAFPQFRLLSNKPFETLCEKIANDWLSQEHYRQNEQELILAFILDANKSIECFNNQYSLHAIQLFLILRGLLSSEVLLVAFKKRPQVNFGVNKNPDFNRLMAVPFRAKDVAAENTEFGHPDIAIVLTQLSYYHNGLNDFQLKQCFDRLVQDESDPAMIYETWISYDNQESIHSSVQQWKGVNLKDYHQRTLHLFPTFRYNILIIDYFLNHFVYPREAKQFPHKLIASAWDLASSIRSKIITGFSGTNDTQLLLPVHIHQQDLPELQQTDALVVNNLLRSENEQYEAFSIDITSDEILQQMINYKRSIQVILDVGALFIDGTNRQIAEKWLKSSDKNKIDYAVYFECDQIFVCDRQLNHHLFLTSPASERLDHCVIYLDEIHTRGSDFKFPKGFRAAVTLGQGLTKDRLVQAAMRMRQLGVGHSLVFWSSYEVHQQIQNLRNKNDQITVRDILRWVYQNTEQATWDGLHHWAAQSLNFQRKLSAFRHIEWKNLQQEFTHTIIEQLGQDCLEPEVIELRHMYGAAKYQQTAYDIYLRRYERLNMPASIEIHQDILKRLKTYGGSKKRLAQLLDEEQERELEQELEEERQIERPPPVKPYQHILHRELERLFDLHGDLLNFNQFTSVFRPLADAFIGTTFHNDCQPNSWHRNLWISTEFQRVLDPTTESLNPFLRPPRWVVYYRNQHIIFLSPFEANWLISHLNLLSREFSTATLRLLLPRLKRNQSIFIDKSTLTIPRTILSSDKTIPLEYLVELFIFNGTLYFANIDEQTNYCKCLGLCPKPRTAREEQAFEKGYITADGFVSRIEHRRLLHVEQCRFNSNPLPFIKQIIENRNNSHASITSHVGSIIFNSLKLL